MDCPLCGTADFYEGLTSRDCRNAKCELYAETEADNKTLPTTGKIKIGGREYTFGPSTAAQAHQALHDHVGALLTDAILGYDIPAPGETFSNILPTLTPSEEQLRAQLAQAFRKLRGI